ncbi:hypothetical protein PspLS_11242 [Pyricularia sp. CBS 133598]|nr:hypothetical protein PspLS_11242 [Pyricularia sp. CBS 133598]
MPPPSCIFVVRHGHRLDAADKQWHLTSPTPYDPPLTYTGWTQSRITGEQIAAILRKRAQSHDDSEPEKKPRRKKSFRVVIHTSPFLRCIQTSIAISSGLASRPSLLADARRALSPLQLSQISQDVGAPGNKPQRSRPVGKKAVLRIDAWLGEWLSPTYFELITPPPGSVMMLASAKATLLKPENYHSYPHIQTRAHSNSLVQNTGSGHLWGSAGARVGPSPLSAAPISAAGNGSTSAPLENMNSMDKALPQLESRQAVDWAHSHRGTVESQRPSTAPPAASDAEVGAYDPPVPSFSISKNAPIPEGYVNHAKDACVVVDYQWDSMRPPYDWGDGGELPEEWSDMHKRFSKGLQKMVDWYTVEEEPATAVTSEAIRPNTASGSETRAEDYNDDDIETVVILVSHGAGCNAMIGAIEHKPALMDVSLSSISLATMKPNSSSPSSNHDGARMHHRYDLKMKANVDHLRPLAPANSLRSPPPGGMFDGNSNSRARANHHSFSSGTASNGSDWNPGSGGMSRKVSSGRSIASFREGLQKSGGRQDTVTPSFTPSGLSRTPSLGLWSPKPSQKVDEECIDDEEAELIDLRKADVGNGDTKHGGSIGKVNSVGEGEDDEEDVVPQLPSTAERPDVVRDTSSSKRRWTVTDRP